MVRFGGLVTLLLDWDGGDGDPLTALGPAYTHECRGSA